MTNSRLRYLLDTSVYSQRLRKRPVSNVVKRWAQLGDASLAISSVCEAELLFGLTKKDSRRLWLEYEEFLKGRLTMLAFGKAEASAYAEIKVDLIRGGVPKSEADIQIAATAKANGLVVATLNHRDFAPMEGVEVEDWS